MEALEWGNEAEWSPGAGNGPWVATDLENGVFTGSALKPNVNATNTPLVATYATIMLKGYSEDSTDVGKGRLVLKGGDATSGQLAIKWDGARPANYSPQHKQGAIELGTGGDGSGGGQGTFFEGAITAAIPPDATDDLVQANIVAAGYGQ
jgi:hypothetical protein